jgi:F0F1-type ATP synthase delta subunit
MKYTPHLYARALTSLLEKGLSKTEEDSVVQNLLALLKRNGDLKHLPKIISLAEHQLIENQGGRNITIETARPIPDIKKKIHFLLRANDVVEEKINPAILAGVRVVINGESQIDASLKSQLDHWREARYLRQ